MPPIRASASVLLARSWDSPETFLVLRSRSQRAFPDTWVFPGGKVDPADSQVPVVGRDPSIPAEAYVAVARELFEETGVLVAAQLGGKALDLPSLPPHRRALLAGEGRFRDVLAALGAQIDGRLLVPLGEKTTPPFHPNRFKNRFFVAVLPPGQSASVIPGELVKGEWMRPRDALARFARGEMLIAPPVLLLLEGLGDSAPGKALEGLTRFSDATFEHRPVRICFSPEILILPGATPTLPPATHTNAIILGADRLLVVDPATDEPEDQHKLTMLLDELAAEGRRVEAVVLTHHHIDHVGATEVVRRHTGAPVWAHPRTAELLPGTRIDRRIADDEIVELGQGGPVRFLHTPGHAPGHLCLQQQKFGALIAGDMVSTVSTIVIDPPEGDMAVYLGSLERLRDLGGRMIYPSHGSPMPDVRGLCEYFLEHRRMREAKVVASLADGFRPLEELVALAYDDTPREMHPIAARSLLASLLKLEAEGKARTDGADRWRRGAP